jgi:hypothetical protein
MPENQTKDSGSNLVDYLIHFGKLVKRYRKAKGEFGESRTPLPGLCILM